VHAHPAPGRMRPGRGLACEPPNSNLQVAAVF
jgi:hypothetical protein